MNETEHQITVVAEYQINKQIEHLNKTLIEPLEPGAKEKTKLRFVSTGLIDSEGGLVIKLDEVKKK